MVDFPNEFDVETKPVSYEPIRPERECQHCKDFKSFSQCSTHMGECDCPKCQGYCECC